jgi:hypothetical protein
MLCEGLSGAGLPAAFSPVCEPPRVYLTPEDVAIGVQFGRQVEL